MSLFLADPGIPQNVVRVGGNPKARQFLENLGITIGSSVTVISLTASGLIIKVRGVRVAVSRSIAGKIFVEEEVSA